jgi:aspartate/methionine/tyrosine aminotransferase
LNRNDPDPVATVTLRPSSRLLAVQPPIVPIVGAWLRDAPGAISLGQGMVAYGPPPQVLEAVRAFGDRPDDHRYGAVDGERALIDALAAKLRDENGITLEPASRLIVTAGANMAFLEAVLAIGDTGDEFVLQAPFYFNHEMAIGMAGCRAVVVPTAPGYQLDPDAIARAITPRTRAVVTVSPNNPTGAVYSEAALIAVNGLCRDRGLFHVHDEAYEYFTYEGATHFSPGGLEGAGGHTLSLFSLSKAYGFASWRIGYMVVPAALFDAVHKIQDTNLICPPLVAQHAALGALSAGRAWCRPRVEALAAVRRAALAELRTLGELCDIVETCGAFYVMLTVRGGADPVSLARRLIFEHGVAVIPGSAFGVADACSVRVSYGALAPATVTEGIARLVRGLSALAGV